jgi:hypothetical protein
MAKMYEPAAKWYVQFQGGRVSIENCERNGRTTTARTADNSALKENAICNNRMITVSEL